jgi:polyhydroxyalkanoate synthesis regulator protein
MEEQTRQNMAMFSQALAMFNPFQVGVGGEAHAAKTEQGGDQQGAQSFDGLKKQLGDMQRQIDELSKRS